MKENKKLGQEPAYPTDFDPQLRKELMSESGGYKPEDMRRGTLGMSKRFYAACAAMQISPELICTEVFDDDVVQDDNGCYVKSSGGCYFVPNSLDLYKPCDRFMVVTTRNHRYVRALYDIADEILKQENK